MVVIQVCCGLPWKVGRQKSWQLSTLDTQFLNPALKTLDTSYFFLENPEDRDSNIESNLLKRPPVYPDHQVWIWLVWESCQWLDITGCQFTLYSWFLHHFVILTSP